MWLRFPPAKELLGIKGTVGITNLLVILTLGWAIVDLELVQSFQLRPLLRAASGRPERARRRSNCDS